MWTSERLKDEADSWKSGAGETRDSVENRFGLVRH